MVRSQSSDTQDRRFHLTAPSGIKALISSYGASLVELHAPDRAGRFADIVLGFDTQSEYALHSNLYFGSTIGRTANRIRGATFELDSVTYQLAANDGKNHLHGGAVSSFDKVDWEAEERTGDAGTAVMFRYVSPHLEEGYPGQLDARVTYTLTDRDELRIDYEARSDRATPVSLTHHSYWNLTGDGSRTILDHELQVEADSYTAVDSELIPIGTVKPVDSTALDFRKPSRIGSRIAELEDTGARGYDHNFVLTASSDGVVTLAARLRDPESGRILEIWTDRPCIQVYSGNFMRPVVGKLGMHYEHRGGVCLEPQAYPDAMHHPNFPSILLHPGEVYRATTVYRVLTD